MHRLPQEQTNEEWLDNYNGGNVAQINPQINERKASSDKPSETREESSLSDELPLIPSGKYFGRYISHQLHKGMFKEGVCKLCVKFEVSGSNIPEGVILEAWYPVIETKDGFSVSKRSKYAHQFFSVFPDSTDTRMDRLWPRKFKGIDLELQVITVTEDQYHNPKPKALYYSEVGRIIGRRK